MVYVSVVAFASVSGSEVLSACQVVGICAVTGQNHAFTRSTSFTPFGSPFSSYHPTGDQVGDLRVQLMTFG